MNVVFEESSTETPGKMEKYIPVWSGFDIQLSFKDSHCFKSCICIVGTNVCSWKCRGSQRHWKFLGLELEAVEPPDMGASYKFQSSFRAVYAFNHWVICPAQGYNVEKATMPMSKSDFSIEDLIDRCICLWQTERSISASVYIYCGMALNFLVYHLTMCKMWWSWIIHYS